MGGYYHIRDVVRGLTKGKRGSQRQKNVLKKKISKAPSL